MKKILLTGVAAALLSSSAMAGQAGDVYGEAKAGFVMFQKNKVAMSKIADQMILEINSSTITAAGATAAAGTNLSGAADLAAAKTAAIAGLTANGANTALATSIVDSLAAGEDQAGFTAKFATAANILGATTYGVAQIDFADATPSIKAKSTGFIGVEGGYYLMDNVSIGGEFKYYFTPKDRYSIAKGDAAFGVEAKTKIMSFMVNTKIDFVDMDGFTAYFTTGVGISRVGLKHKYNAIKSAADAEASAEKLKTLNDAETSANKTNFAYSVGMGIKMDIAEGISGNASYEWTDLGRTKREASTERYLSKKGHHFTLGVKFDI